MSIEYFANPNPQLSQTEIAACISALEADPSVEIVRKKKNEIGLCFGASESSDIESVTLSFSPSAVYVGFHAATRDQRESFLAFLSDRLTASGYSCSFEEE